MKKNIIRIILIILLALTFYIIFGFSSQNSKESSGISSNITRIITDRTKFIQKKPDEEKNIIIKRIESIIRKLAHFSIYTVVRYIVNVICIYI